MNKLVLPRKKPKLFHELNAIVTIMARDITLCFKSPGTIVMSIAMPMVMMGMLGGGLAQNMAGGLNFEYGPFMMVGMLIVMLFMITTMGITTLVEDRLKDFTQEMMISPVSRYSIVIGKIFGSSFSALVGMMGTLIVGLVMGIALNPGQMLMLLVLSPFMCLAAGALAMIVIGLIKSNRMANIAIMLITMPQLFLSGAIIPINNSSGVLFVLSRIMPMTYCLDLARAVVYAGTPEYESIVLFNPVLNFAVIAMLTVAFLMVGTFLFVRSEKNR
jgi:ABC-2 type transport system permease protein